MGKTICDVAYKPGVYSMPLKRGRSKSSPLSTCQTICSSVTCPPGVRTYRPQHGWYVADQTSLPVLATGMLEIGWNLMLRGTIREKAPSTINPLKTADEAKLRNGSCCCNSTGYYFKYTSKKALSAWNFSEAKRLKYINIFTRTRIKRLHHPKGSNGTKYTSRTAESWFGK